MVELVLRLEGSWKVVTVIEVVGTANPNCTPLYIRKARQTKRVSVMIISYVYDNATSQLLLQSLKQIKRGRSFKSSTL